MISCVIKKDMMWWVGPSQSLTKRLRAVFLIEIMPTFAIIQPTISVLIDARSGINDRC